MRPLPELSDEIPEAVKPKAELAAAYLTEVIKAMEVKDFTITPKMREDTLVLLIEGSDLGVVIGRRAKPWTACRYSPAWQPTGAKASMSG